MTRLTALGLLLPLLAAVPIAGAPVATAAATCQGRPATIEVAHRDVVRGTDGDDVIAVTDVEVVLAGRGADLVCATGYPGPDDTRIVAGEGDDSVTTTDGGSGRGVARFVVNLGAGEDRFVGGAGVDDVRAEGEVAGDDMILTGAGDDSVSSGRVGARNGDVVRLGSGSDRLQVRGVLVGDFDAGPVGQPDSVGLRGTGTGPHRFDLRSGAARVGAGRARLAGFDELTLSQRPARLMVRGTARDEAVYVRAGADRALRVDVDLGGGRDVLAPTGLAGVTGRVALGPGEHDRLWLDSGKMYKPADPPFSGTVEGSLATGRFRVAGSPLRVRGVEDVIVTFFRTVRLRGNSRDNRLDADACRVDLAGGAGDDRLEADTVPRTECPGARSGSTQRGQAGDDVLLGTALADVLIGGPGRDRALGRNGPDRCTAEVVRC